MRLAALFLSLVLPLSAQESVEGTNTDVDEAAQLQAMQSTLRSDPAVADSLAERISRSKLSFNITKAADPQTRLDAIRHWIDSDPKSAALLAVGLAKDDEAGNTHFEDILAKNLRTYSEKNPNAEKNTFNTLKRVSRDSGLMKKDLQMSGEEKQEIVRTLFEGQGGMSNKVLEYQEANGAKPQEARAGIYAGGLYDRLSQGNLTGYSPDILAIQSRLNGLRAPGAPKLIETGKLDYETLSYPAFAMRYDLKNLEARLVFEKNMSLAKLLGLERSYRPEQLADPALAAELEAKARGKAAVSPRLAKRFAVLGRVKKALAEFDELAQQSRDPGNITRGLLLSLGAKQKEAARWITAAALEEEVSRIENEEGFLSPELLAAIDAAPAPEQTRAAYRRRGEEFKAKLLKVKAEDEAALGFLEADDWAAHAAAVDAAVSRNSPLHKALSRDIGDFAITPFRLQENFAPKPRWRAFLDTYIKRFLPGTAYARRLKAEEKKLDAYKDVFDKIARGDLDAAHAELEASR